MRTQAQVAPYLFSRLESSDDTKCSMWTNQNPDRHAEEFIAVPLPRWLDQCDKGLFILQSYMAFLKEWVSILLRHSAASLKCHPLTAGRGTIFSLKAFCPNSSAIGISPCTVTDSQNIVVLNEKESTVAFSQPIKNGIRYLTVEFFGPSRSQLKQFHLNLQEGAVKTSKEKKAWSCEELLEPYLVQMPPKADLRWMSLPYGLLINQSSF
jgi:hypothetical protein